MFGKRGLSGTAITIIIVFVVLVAVILIYTFSVTKEEAPSPVSEQCAYFCETNQQNAFCTFKVSAGDTLRVTCNELSTNSRYSSYGVQACPAILCTIQPQGNSVQASDQTCSGLEGTWETPTSSGICPEKQGFYSRIRTAEDSPPTAGQICCYYYQ